MDADAKEDTFPEDLCLVDSDEILGRSAVLFNTGWGGCWGQIMCGDATSVIWDGTASIGALCRELKAVDPVDWAACNDSAAPHASSIVKAKAVQKQVAADTEFVDIYRNMLPSGNDVALLVDANGGS